MRVRIDGKTGASEIELQVADVRTLEAALRLARAIEKHGDAAQTNTAGGLVLSLLELKQQCGLLEVPT